jgi:hypothetical protein
MTASLANIRFSQSLRGVPGVGFSPLGAAAFLASPFPDIELLPAAIYRWRHHGMGQDGAGVSVRKPLVSFGAETGAALTTAATGAAASGTSITASLAVPLIGAAIAGVLLGLKLWLGRMGPKQKRWTSQMADEAEKHLVELNQAWQSSNKHASEQAVILQGIDEMFALLEQKCGDPKMGEPGQRCINERLRPGQPAPWCPKPGHVGCDWIALYRDPVANDPEVVPDPTAAEQIFASGAEFLGMEPGNFSKLLIPAALVALALAL